MSLVHRVVAPLALAAVVLTVSACGSDDPGPAPDPTADASPSAEQDDDGAQEGDGADDAATDDGAADDDTAGGADLLEIAVVGDEGVLALQYSGPAPAGADGPTGHKLITGPGGCFALTDEGRPQLVVFPQDATFVLQDGRPSATVAGEEHFVGQQFPVETTEVDVSEVTGIPERCGHGSADTVLVVG